MTLEEVKEFLGSRNLRFEVNDSSFYLDKKPLSVLSQYPKPGTVVKEDRKIYLSINSQVPPEVKMPKLIDNSLKSAEMTLKSFGLQLGNISYRKDLAQNAILDQLINGKPVKAGTLVKKGTKIDLVVGDGLGETEFEIPDLIGMDRDDAEVLLMGQGLRIGVMLYDESAASGSKGKVVRQIPAPGGEKKIRMGETIDLWIGGVDPAKQFSDEDPVE
jgi:beta-lactam-binding protein with PASTA domain